MEKRNLINVLNALSTTHFCDASSDVRIFSRELQCITEPCTWIGKAFTVKADGDLLPVMQAIEKAAPGDVLVIAANSTKQCALAGEIFTTAALQKDIAGIVLDDFCRDIDTIRNLPLPFYAKGVWPYAGTKQKLGQLNVPVLCGEISVSPNDIIIGDESGLIALSENEFNRLLPIATEIKLKEVKALEQLFQNKKLSDLFNLDEHLNNIKCQIPSSLKWL